MKSFLRIIILLHIILLFTGCKSDKISPLLYKDEPKDEHQNKAITLKDSALLLDYTIDKVTLSKSYQTINPTVEIIKHGLESNLLLSLGIVQSTGVNIEKIEKIDNDINIYVQNKNKDSEGQIVVPQVLLNLTGLSSEDIKGINFKIINQNYKPIKANIDIGEAVGKAKSALKISTSTFPETNIEQKDGKLFLGLKFINAIDLEDKENPIINLTVLIDATDGRIIKSTKESVSSLIDQGSILEYVPNRYIFYEKELQTKDARTTSLWMYDILKDTKEKVYTTKNKIQSIKFNQESEKLFLIESFLEYNELYIVELKDLKTYKANLDLDISPSMAVWKDIDNIVLIDKNDTASNVYNLNVNSNKLDFIAQIDLDVKEIQHLEDNFIFTLEKEKSKEIYLTKDFNKITLIDKGDSPLLLDDSTVAYLKHDFQKNKHILWIYDINDGSIDSYSDRNIKEFFKWGDNLGIIEKNQIGSDNPLYLYDLVTQELKFIDSIRSDKVFLNSDKNIFYINFSVDLDEKKIPIICFIEF